jgi:hypothetical protein
MLILLWFVLLVWWLAYKTRLWLSGFGGLILTVTGLFFGLMFFSAFHEWFKWIEAQPKAWKKTLALIGFGMSLLFFGLWFVRGALWFSNFLGNLYGASFWILLGFIFGAGVVYFSLRFSERIEAVTHKALDFFEEKD